MILKIWKRLLWWKVRQLSFVRRVSMIKYVITFYLSLKPRNWC